MDNAGIEVQYLNFCVSHFIGNLIFLLTNNSWLDIVISEYLKNSSTGGLNENDTIPKPKPFYAGTV